VELRARVVSVHEAGKAGKIFDLSGKYQVLYSNLRIILTGMGNTIKVLDTLERSRVADVKTRLFSLLDSEGVNRCVEV
jgi:hypothetical protein